MTLFFISIIAMFVFSVWYAKREELNALLHQRDEVYLFYRFNAAMMYFMTVFMLAAIVFYYTKSTLTL